MIDGFGEDYYRASNIPTLNRLARQGLFKIVKGAMPSVTNTNNASICTGTPASVNRITGNSFFDTASDREEFMEDSCLLLSPTIFDRAAAQRVKPALFLSKKKTISLLSRGTTGLIWSNLDYALDAGLSFKLQFCRPLEDDKINKRTS